MTKSKAKTSRAMKTDYRERVIIPHDGHPSMRLHTKDSLLVAVGYVRVEFGGRGPYVEFTEDQVQKDNLHLVEFVTDDDGRTYRHRYFHEYRTNDAADAMVYLQRRGVSYATYHVGMYYVSPFDLFTADGKAVVTSSRSLAPFARNDLQPCFFRPPPAQKANAPPPKGAEQQRRESSSGNLA